MPAQTRPQHQLGLASIKAQIDNGQRRQDPHHHGARRNSGRWSGKAGSRSAGAGRSTPSDYVTRRARRA